MSGNSRAKTTSVNIRLIATVPTRLRREVLKSKMVPAIKPVKTARMIVGSIKISRIIRGKTVAAASNVASRSLD